MWFFRGKFTSFDRKTLAHAHLLKSSSYKKDGSRANIYLLKVNNSNNKKGVTYVQS